MSYCSGGSPFPQGTTVDYFFFFGQRTAAPFLPSSLMPFLPSFFAVARPPTRPTTAYASRSAVVMVRFFAVVF